MRRPLCPPCPALRPQLWPAANFVNFRFVPPEQRILYVNAIYIGWVSFLSTMASSSSSDPPGPLARLAADGDALAASKSE